MKREGEERTTGTKRKRADNGKRDIKDDDKRQDSSGAASADEIEGGQLDCKDRDDGQRKGLGGHKDGGGFGGVYRNPAREAHADNDGADDGRCNPVRDDHVEAENGRKRQEAFGAGGDGCGGEITEEKRIMIDHVNYVKGSYHLVVKYVTGDKP
ncbi:hypothetical protein HK101_005249 [Irineochytrium annulatum]|nr:hypothetical protein HK101_005249 [Irineochytrium annulatum]